MAKAKVFTAYMWTCEACEALNFEQAVRAEITPDERREMVDNGNLPLNEIDIEMVVPPETVVCGNCAEAYEVELDSE